MLPDPRRPTRDALTGADSVDDGRPRRSDRDPQRCVSARTPAGRTKLTWSRLPARPCRG